jgi:prepilin-type N-terminal cleavage/methylation domain-containing protein
VKPFCEGYFSMNNFHKSRVVRLLLPAPIIGERGWVKGKTVSRIHRYAKRTDCIQAFTLVELLVVLVIIGILSALVMGALRGAQQDTLAAKTRGTIAKIDAVLNERFDEYMTKPLKFADDITPIPNRNLNAIPSSVSNLFARKENFPVANRISNTSPNKIERFPSPIFTASVLREQVRLAATRDLMRMEMPDCVGDLYTNGFSRITALSAVPIKTSVALATGYFYRNIPNINSNTPIAMQLETPAAMLRIIRKTWEADQRLRLPLPDGRKRIDPNSGIVGTDDIRWSDTFSNEELLFMIVEDSFVDGSPAIEAFASSEIGDKDDDGLKEFLDAWGNPIRWIRWPAGANTVTPLDPDPLNPFGALPTDPYDPTFADIAFYPPNVANPNSQPGNGLRPLVVSAGQDGRFGIRFFAAPGISALFSVGAFHLNGSTNPLPPAYSPTGFNWPDPYYPRGSFADRLGGTLILGVEGDSIGVDINATTPGFLPHPNTDARYLLHAQDNVTNLDESGAAP